MLKMKEESRLFLEKYLPEALEKDVLNDVLDPLYELIDLKGFTLSENISYNDFGREAQKVYDDLFYSNLSPERAKMYGIED